MSKILIIEDEKELADILSQKIEAQGHEVDMAYDGRDGLEKIKEGPDLVMLDMLMPELDGFGVLEEMKKNGIKIPVIIISNSGQPVDIERARELGAKDYLIKAELDPQEIIEKIQYCLSNEKKSADKGVRKMLIIEDDEFLQRLIAKKMHSTDFYVEVASDGNEGLEKIVQGRPDLVLLDIILPGLKGYEVLEKVRNNEDEDIAKTPIIMLSNLGQDSDVKKAIDLGADDYLMKASFTIDEILEKVKKYVR